jgi:hypothetical protein
MRLSGPRSRPTATQKMWQRRESNPLGLQPGSLTTTPQRRSLPSRSFPNYRRRIISILIPWSLVVLRKADSRSALAEMLGHFMEPEGTLPVV